MNIQSWTFVDYSNADLLLVDHYHLYKFLNNRRSGLTHRRFDYQHVHQYTRAPSTSILTEDPIQVKNYDKIFSSAWISMLTSLHFDTFTKSLHVDNDRVVVGTKDNKVRVRYKTQVSLIHSCSLLGITATCY